MPCCLIKTPLFILLTSRQTGHHGEKLTLVTIVTGGVVTVTGSKHDRRDSVRVTIMVSTSHRELYSYKKTIY